MKRTSRDIRLANRFDVLRHIIAEHTVSRQEIVAETGLSLATVSTLVGELLDLGLLKEVGYQDSGGGRPRGLIAVNTGGGLLVGVDVAETYVHVELFNPELSVLARAEEELHPEENRPEQVVQHIVSSVRSVIAGTTRRAQPEPGFGGGEHASSSSVRAQPEPGFGGGEHAPSASVRAQPEPGFGRGEHASSSLGAAPRRVLGVGVSVPGQVEREGGVSVFAPNWNWHDVPLRSMLSAQLGLPLYLDNPLKASTVAELWFGAGRGRDDVVVLTLGTGVGAGLALGGSLYRGATNSAGEWGHTTLVLDGRLCHCGSRGCVETYVGAPGIMQHLRDLAPGSPMLHPDDQTGTIDALARALADGDPVAAKVVSETARYLGVAIADLVNLFNPQVIVLSSWVAAKLGETLLSEVRSVVARRALRRPFANTEIVLCPIASNPVSLGAATFALEGFLSTIGQRS